MICPETALSATCLLCGLFTNLPENGIFKLGWQLTLHREKPQNHLPLTSQRIVATKQSNSNPVGSFMVLSPDKEKMAISRHIETENVQNVGQLIIMKSLASRDWNDMSSIFIFYIPFHTIQTAPVERNILLPIFKDHVIANVFQNFTYQRKFDSFLCVRVHVCDGDFLFCFSYEIFIANIPTIFLLSLKTPTRTERADSRARGKSE